MIKKELEKKLIVGTKIKIGKNYAEKYSDYNFKEGEIIELVEGWFEHDNGLYVTDKPCPSWWNTEEEDFESIYHLFGNDIEDFMDCELL